MNKRNVRRSQRPRILTRVRLLVFDDDAAHGKLLRSMLLQESGASINATPSLETALELHRRTPYHVIIAVITPGSWAGYELIKAIRETDEEYRGFTPMIAIGFASPQDEQRAIAAGFNAYIPRPFGASDVINEIVRVLHDSAKRAA